MTLVVKFVLFLLGMGLCVQWVGAVYGIIDRWYSFPNGYRAVIQDILIWSGVIGIIAGVAGNTYRPAFLWGVGLFLLLYVAGYLATLRLAERMRHRSMPE